MNSARLPFCLAFLFATALSSFARLVPNWPADKLFAEVDLVVVVQALENKDAKDTIPLDPKYHRPADYKAVETRFKVLGVLKNTKAGDRRNSRSSISTIPGHSKSPTVPALSNLPRASSNTSGAT